MVWPAGPAGVVQRQLEHQLGRRRDDEVASRGRGQHVQVFLDRLEDRVRVQLDVAA